MEFDFTPFFKQYEALLRMGEETFLRVSESHADLVRCRVGCDDCCYALFDLTLIEALYINHKFNETFQGQDRESRIEIANRIDRQTHKIKKRAYQDLKSGKNEELILMEMAGERVKCPLLNQENQCDLYEHRPITCRLYGIPTAINGVGYSCGKSGFIEGEPYPTANLDPVQKRLYEISAALVEALKSKHATMAEIIVPVSMALITDYDEVYLGVEAPAGEPEDAEEPSE
jgi:Fe-S-cluster containining protein